MHKSFLTLCSILLHGHHSVLWLHTYSCISRILDVGCYSPLTSSNYNDPVLVRAHFPSHTYKYWSCPPFSAFFITTVGPHPKSECSQWSESWLSCDDSGSGRTIHNLFTMETTVIILETNLIFSDISCSICWWVPVQCHRRLVWVYSSCQFWNLVWSESFKNIDQLNIKKMQLNTRKQV